jgi:hypothetical protein
MIGFAGAFSAAFTMISPESARRLDPEANVDVDEDEDLETPEMRLALFRLGARPSQSADAARARSIEEMRAMPVRERMLLALRLGRRDRAIREAFLARKREL